MLSNSCNHNGGHVQYQPIIRRKHVRDQIQAGPKIWVSYLSRWLRLPQLWLLLQSPLSLNPCQEPPKSSIWPAEWGSLVYTWICTICWYRCSTTAPLKGNPEGLCWEKIVQAGGTLSSTSGCPSACSERWSEHRFTLFILTYLCPKWLIIKGHSL